MMAELPTGGAAQRGEEDARDAGMDWVLVATPDSREYAVVTGSPRMLQGAQQEAQELLDLLALNLGARQRHDRGPDLGQSAADAARLRHLGTTRRADCAHVIVKDDVVAAFCAIDRDLTLAVRSALAADAHFAMLLKSAAQDARDTLLARLGPPAHWANRAARVRAIITPLVFDPMVPFFHPLALYRPLADRIFTVLSRAHADAVFEAPSVASLGHAAARARIEQTMDEVEQQLEPYNETLDDTDLCLAVGSLAIARGALVHASLCADDVHDVYRALLAEGGLLDATTLARRVLPLYAAVDRSTGARMATFLAQRPGSDCTLEPRVLAVVASQGIVFARLLVSLQASAEVPSGHLDPYGLERMERALCETLQTQTLQAFCDDADAAARSVIRSARGLANPALDEAAGNEVDIPTPGRGPLPPPADVDLGKTTRMPQRSQSFDASSTSMWTRLTSSFRGRRRARASSLVSKYGDAAPGQDDEAGESDRENSDRDSVRSVASATPAAADLHSEANVTALRATLRSALAHDVARQQLGAVVLGPDGVAKDASRGREVHLRPPPRRALAHNSHCLETYLEEVTERSFADVAAQYGLAPLEVDS